jgi:hypothetical protein
VTADHDGGFSMAYACLGNNKPAEALNCGSARGAQLW